MNKISRATSFPLIVTLLFGPLSRAQTAPPLEIQVRVVAGISATYEAGSLQGTKLAVEVTNQAGARLPGVAVTFRLPEEGATGVFADGTRAAVIYTSEQGEAAVSGIRWGAIPGTLSIRITAVKGSAHAGILAAQELIAGAHPATGAVPVVRPATVPPPTVSIASKPVTSAPAAVVASTPQKPARVKSEVTIVTQPEKTKTDALARTAITHLPAGAEAKAKEPPAVTISSAPPGHGMSGKGKWILIGVVAAGAVAGLAFAMGGKSSSTASPTPVQGTTIGAPSISIGHP